MKWLNLFEDTLASFQIPYNEEQKPHFLSCPFSTRFQVWLLPVSSYRYWFILCVFYIMFHDSIHFSISLHLSPLQHFHQIKQNLTEVEKKKIKMEKSHDESCDTTQWVKPTTPLLFKFTSKCSLKRDNCFV